LGKAAFFFCNPILRIDAWQKVGDVGMKGDNQIGRFEKKNIFSLAATGVLAPAFSFIFLLGAHPKLFFIFDFCDCFRSAR
jgi:hypothetical protein